MHPIHPFRFSMAIAALALLSACGGGGGGVASTPTPPAAPPAPPPSPPPPPVVSPVEILQAPTTQEFKTFSSEDPTRVRYDAATGKYEIKLPGKDWDALLDDPQSQPGVLVFASNPNFAAGHVSQVTRFTHPDPDRRYLYSNLSFWRMGEESSPDFRQGAIVFGTATPAGAVPVTGAATYNGLIAGSADFPADGGGYGTIEPAPIGGVVTLQFDFAKGSLSGRMVPVVGCDCQQIDFPRLNLIDTAFAVGSQTFAGRFDTNVIGDNSFSGLFTGPHAEELIGQWTFPFLFEGQPHSAAGVWIAKQ